MLSYVLKRSDAFAEGVWRTGRGSGCFHAAAYCHVSVSCHLAGMSRILPLGCRMTAWREPSSCGRVSIGTRCQREARPIPAVPVRPRIPTSASLVFLPVKEVDNVVRRQAVQVDSEFPASLWSQIHFPFMYSSSALVILAHSVRVILFPCIMCHSCHLEAGFRQGVARARESGCPLSALSAGAAGEAPGRHPK